MSSPESIKRYIGAVLIPVIANVRIGHLSEAKIMESIGVNLIDESDMLTSTEVPYIRNKRGADPPSDTTLYADPSIFKPLLNEVVRTGHLPVPLFGSGGIHTPSDVAIMMENGCDGVFVDTAVFLGLDPETHLKAIMQATKDYKNTSKMCELSNYFI
ncbi:hypothetical protein H4S03_007580 [Coemansia sp. S3946]|nr:hypothetical protein H4S03_007580 [Coemansia sp. S3946]